MAQQVASRNEAVSLLAIFQCVLGVRVQYLWDPVFVLIKDSVHCGLYSSHLFNTIQPFSWLIHIMVFV